MEQLKKDIEALEESIKRMEEALPYADGQSYYNSKNDISEAFQRLQSMKEELKAQQK